MELKLNELTVHMIPPGGRIRAMVYTVMEPDEAEQVAAMLADQGLMLCAISGIDWNDALSPWPAAAVFRDAFGGRAEAFLQVLIHQIVPLCEREAVAAGYEVPEERVLAGYSLAGLFALWAVCRTAVFTRCASMSGSLWFDGFTDWFAAHHGDLHAASVWLSLGDREAKARSPRMARVEDATRATLRLLAEDGVLCELTMESGGHFNDVPGRIARGLMWTAGQINAQTH